MKIDFFYLIQYITKVSAKNQKLCKQKKSQIIKILKRKYTTKFKLLLLLYIKNKFLNCFAAMTKCI